MIGDLARLPRQGSEMTVSQIKAKVLRREELTKGIVRLTLEAPEIAVCAQPGQFMMFRATDKLDPLLRRPLSIHQVSSGSQVQVLLKVVGRGSRFLAERERGDVLDVVGPLGHGFSAPTAPDSSVCLVGGGIGCAPLYFLAKMLLREDPGRLVQVFLGAATADELLVVKKDFENLGGRVALATDDGSLGYHGYVTDLLAANLERERRWQVYGCGPHPMLGKLAEFCAAEKWSCQVSLETMMACGISACLGCTVRRAQTKGEIDKPFLHVCKDGPVFDSGEVAWGREGR